MRKTTGRFAASRVALVSLAVAMAAAIAPAAANADTYTDGYGQTWTYTASGRKATLTAISDKTLNYPAEDFPWMFANNGTNYTVTAIGASLCSGWQTLTGKLSIPSAMTTMGSDAFNSCKGLTGLEIAEGPSSVPYRAFYSASNLAGALIIPHSATEMGSQSFLWTGTKLTSLWVKGREKVSSGTQTYTSIMCGSGNVLYSKGNLGLKVALYGRYTKPSGVNSHALYILDKCIVYLPRNGYWLESDEGTHFEGGTKTIIYYGVGEELDIAIDETRNVLAATPTTVHALTNVLASAATFKDDFGLDTKISLTNAFEYAADVFTGTAAESVTFERLFFSVATEAQLSAILAAFPSTTSIALDPSGLKETLTIPAGREIAVKSGEGYEIKKLTSGFKIVACRSSAH